DEQLLEWSLRAGSGTSVAEMMTDYMNAIAQPLGFEAALLWRIGGDAGDTLLLEHMTVLPPMVAAEASSPLPLRATDNQAAASLRVLTALPMSGSGGPSPSALEQALFNRWRARDAVWLPLSVRGDAFGMVLLLSRERRALALAQLETDL